MCSNDSCCCQCLHTLIFTGLLCGGMNLIIISQVRTDGIPVLFLVLGILMIISSPFYVRYIWWRNVKWGEDDEPETRDDNCCRCRNSGSENVISGSQIWHTQTPILSAGADREYIAHGDDGLPTYEEVMTETDKPFKRRL